MIIESLAVQQEQKEKNGRIVLTVENLSAIKGANCIFKNVSFVLPESKHLAIVGKNGAGKTTILEMIIGDECPDYGTIQMPKDINISYVPQSIENLANFDAGKSVLEYFLESRSLLEIKSRMEEIEKIFESNQDQTLINEYGELQTEYEVGGGYTLETDAQQVLEGIGLTGINMQTKLETLSGGEKTKLFLAQALISDADLLLLDEPSNHLDPESVIWLGNYLKRYKRSILIISHRRDLLDSCAEGILELSESGMNSFQGNYSEYIDQKTSKEIRDEKIRKKKEKEIKRLTEVVNRLRAGDRSKTSKDRQRKLDRISTDILKKENIKNVRGIFDIERQSGFEVLRLVDLKKIFGSKTLDYSTLNLTLQRGERVGIVGPVGIGKSTLLKMVSGNIMPDAGEIKVGINVDIGYYAQEMDNLCPENTVLEEIIKNTSDVSEQSARSMLGAFLFSGDDVFKKIQYLSFGERSRLMLAKLSIQKSNFLVLDEPSNHLDISTRKIIAERLKDYDGTMLVVSHDEAFMEGIGLDRIVTLGISEEVHEE